MRQSSSMAEFMLTIYSVKLTVKFPCQMNLQQDGRPITHEVEARDNIFIFNQDVTIKVDPKEDVEINAFLSTGKGGSILAGLISIPAAGLAAKEGQRFSLPLQKCIDTAAFFELKVNHVWIPQERPSIGMVKSHIGGVLIRSTSPTLKSKMKSQNEQVQTRSQIQINTPRRVPTITVGNIGNITMRREKQRERSNFLSPGNQRFNSPRKQSNEPFEEDIRETRTIGGYASRVKREKDKERMEKLAAKKIQDQTENNLKMDIMKYKMKAEEMQKSVTQKTRTIKELRDQIVEIQKKNIEKSYIQQQLHSKQNTIKLLQQRIIGLNAQNINLRETIAENLKSISELKQNIRFDILKNKEQFEKKEQILRQELSETKSKINQHEADQINKQNQLLKARKYIEDLESSAEQKIFEHDKIIQDLKKDCANSIRILNTKISEYEAKIEQLQRDLTNKNGDIAKLNDTIIKYEHNIKIVQEKIHVLEVEKAQLAIFKMDFQNLTKKYTKLQQNLRDEERNSKKILESKNKQLQDNQDIYNKNIKSMEEKLAAQIEKSKDQKTKIQQLQGTIQIYKAEQEKLKKSIEKSQKYCQQLLTKLQNSQKQIKSFQLKYQTLEKQLVQKTNNFNHMQSLYKIQLEHTKQYANTMSKQLQETSTKYVTTKQLLELSKNEKVKLQNKIHLIQDNITRLNEYLKQKRTQFQSKQKQYKETIINLNKNIKIWQQNDKNKQKQINSWQIKDLNNHNKIDKLQRTLQQYLSRIQKLEKTTIPKIQQQKSAIIHQLQQTKNKLIEVNEQNKFITNERIKLENETNKNNKINTVLSEEKIGYLNEINKLKNHVARYEKIEEKLNGELKIANDENKRYQIKIENLEKEITKHKETLNETMSSILTYKKGLKQSSQIKKKQSYIDNLISSRVIHSFPTLYPTTPTNQSPNTNNTNHLNPPQIDIKRISQILETTSKEQQNIIITQQESLHHYKDTIEKLQKQIASLSITTQSNEYKLQETIDHITAELDEANEKIFTLTNQYEDKISKLQTEVSKKEKDIKGHKSTIGALKYQLETVRKKIQILSQQAESRQYKNNERTIEMTNQINFLEKSIKALEQEKRNLQNRVYTLEDEIYAQKEEKAKKQRYILEISEKLSNLTTQHEELTANKKETYEQLLSLKQQVQALRESNHKNQQLVRNQEKTNKRLQQFINDLIKQKESIVKTELQSSSKAIQMQSTVHQMKNLLQNKEQLLKQKEEQINSYKNNIKTLQNEIKIFENQIKECNAKINNLNAKVQQKDKKIVDKQNQIKELITQHTSIYTKNKEEMRVFTEQYEAFRRKSQFNEDEKDNKIFILEKKITELESEIQTINAELIQKQEQVFFQKQRASLSESIINDMKKSQSEVNLIISKYEAEINQLTQEITQKEQLLYDYSGKIYQLEQRLQAKETEIAIREQKIDMDWQCRHDEICEEYEHKIEVLEKEKKYMKDKLDLVEYERTKVQSQKEISAEQFEKDIGSIKAREKQVEEEKLKELNMKTKQIQGLKNQITLISNQVKNWKIEVKKKQNLIAGKDDVIKKLELKILDIDKNIQTLKKRHEEEINNLKKNQNVIKTLKEEIKNAQWVAQRQSKKITQTFIQKVVNCFPQAKEKLVEPIRMMENSMAAAINFKI